MKKLPSVWSIYRRALKTYRSHLRFWLGLTLIVALPVGLLSLANVSTVTAYGSLAALIMNAALLWAILLVAAGEKPKVKHAYYYGSGSLVRLLLVGVILMLELIPFFIGATFFNATISSDFTAVGLPERLLVGVLWLILAVPSLYFITRSIFAPLIVAGSEASPVESVRNSWRLVKGRSWAVFGRLAGLAVVMLVIVLLPTVPIVASLSNSPVLPLALGGLQIVFTIILLPISYLYLFELYRELT